jgi:hypothetical protein
VIPPCCKRTIFSWVCSLIRSATALPSISFIRSRDFLSGVWEI